MVWAKTEMLELGISRKAVDRWRRELRDHRLMSSITLVNQTITLDRFGPVEPDLLRKFESLETQYAWSLWHWSRAHGTVFDPWSVVDCARTRHGNPWAPRGSLVFRRVFRWAAEQKAGSMRMKALGLLLLLWAEAPGDEHTLSRIEDRLKLDPSAGRRYRRELTDLGFATLNRRKIIRIQHLNLAAFRKV